MTKKRAGDFYKIFKEATYIDYKNIENLKPFVDRFGRIIPRYYTNMSLKKQKMLSQAIKNARLMALLPFVK
jgi:small subunit ribosomal protein S18